MTVSKGIFFFRVQSFSGFLTKGAGTAALSRIKDVAFLLANSATHSLVKPPLFFKGLHHTPSSACQLFIRLRKKRAGYLFDSLLFSCYLANRY